ncbi:hypothetical protein KY362_04935 [Candidatus Woesearchaeota archaeon]|nr:hypothetical protein [Candidatus Woesearchaeota archaeon]
MGKITSRQELLDALGKMREMEIQARDNYVADISEFSDIHITSAIQGVMRDEDKHIEILDGLIEGLG